MYCQCEDIPEWGEKEAEVNSIFRVKSCRRSGRGEKSGSSVQKGDRKEAAECSMSKKA